MNLEVYKNTLEELIDNLDKAELNPPILFSTAFEIINQIVNEICSKEKKYFSNFTTKLNFVIGEFSISKELETRLRLSYSFYLRLTKSNYQLYCSSDDIDFILYTTAQFIEILEDGITVSNFSKLNKNAKLSAYSKVNLEKDNLSDDVTLIIENKKISKSKSILFECRNEENEIVILKLYDIWSDLYVIAWKGAKLKLFSVQIVNGEQTIITAGKDSLVVLEPDYMIDATDIAECFDSVGINVHLYFLKKLNRDRISKSLVLGNVINTLFDELLSDMFVDFNSVFEKALLQKPISSFSLAMSKPTESKLLRESAAVHFESLRTLMPDLKSGNLSVEPSFISPIYGIKGRLDLLQEFEENPDKKNIIELKSGKAPSLDYFYKNKSIGVKTGLWMNHLAQTTCYNLLLDTAFEKRTGTTTILYSSSPKSPLRAAPNIFKNKQEVVHTRNRITALEKKISEDNYEEIYNLRPNIIGSVPSYVEMDVFNFSLNFDRLSEVERLYFLKNVAFIFREIAASNIGSFTKNSNKAANSLWNSTGISDNPNIINKVQLINDKCEFEKGYLSFSFSVETNNSIRYGDSVILYPYSNEKKIYNEQIIKAAVREINNDFITITLRNKLIKESLLKETEFWNIASDNTDSLYKKNLKLFSGLIKTDQAYRDLILGIREPQFEAVNFAGYKELSEKQNELLKQAISAKDYYLIQGPPGTGKTSYMLRYLVKYLFDETTENVLLLAYTNRAVDEICSALKNATPEIPFIRLGSKESSVFKENTLSDIVWQKSLNESYKLIKKTRVFCATTSFLANNTELFELKKFNTVIIDESAQIVENQLTGFLSEFDRFILIGDEKQLPAVVLQEKEHSLIKEKNLNEIELADLSASLFSRLLKICQKNDWQNAFGMLTHQARMHRDIQEFPNINFYSNALLVYHTEKQNEYRQLFDSENQSRLERFLNDHRSLFIASKTEYSSKMNIAEAKLIAKITSLFAERFGQEYVENNLGIIAPFRLQCAEIRKRLAPKYQNKVLVDTVERFQGSEKEVILISFAVNRAGEMDNIISEFEIDGITIDRKLNVALTRAKENLVILGNEDALNQSKVYKKLIEFHKENSAFIRIEELD
ncbi:MAG: AAA domain-containing protein [bacterium]